MMFNMGAPAFSKFKNFWAALKSNDYATASVEMMDSKWAEQVKGRAVTLSEMMSDG
jgi:lysozyme